MKKVLDTICSLGLAAIVTIMFLQVLARYVFHIPIAWPGELSRYLFIWVVLLGSVSTLVDNEHFDVDAIVNRCGARTRILMRIVAGLVMGAVLLTLLFYGWSLTGRVSTQLSPALRIPMKWVYCAVPVSSALMLAWTSLGIVRAVGELIRVIRGRSSC